ncbi:MAG: hypothetical protein JW995_01915 [Melioribacteraceae bacterium]|nr:hypothetical protein [Melioribacteraceae bacterium]
MGRTSTKYIYLCILLVCLVNSLFAQDADPISEKSVLDGLSIGGQWFVGYFITDEGGIKGNDFTIKRGYITFQKKFDDHISVRLTQDITVDQEGDGMGDIELRIKYAYVKYTFDNYEFFTKPAVTFGVIPRPWLSYEQKINNYRAQGRMYLERVGVISSADYGLMIETLLGGQMPEDYRENVNKEYAGKYGSIAVGVYNGGGYNKLEFNEQKNVEARISLRPMPELIPGLQFSYIGSFGTGNTEAAPDYKIDAGFISYEDRRVVFGGTLYTGVGTQDGKAVDAFGKSVEQIGYSAFTEIKLYELNMSVIGRYDYFKQDYSPSEQEYKGIILGAAYHFLKGSKILVSYDTTDIINGITNTTSIIEATLELRF